MGMAFRLSDTQWELVAPIVAPAPRLETRGRKRQPDKPVLEAVLWMIQNPSTGWRDLSREEPFPPFQSVHRRFHEWREAGVIPRVLEALARDMEIRGGVPLAECFLDNLWSSLSPNAIVLYESDGSEYRRSWELNTKAFFETSRVWQWLMAMSSHWIQSRLPADIYMRAEVM